MEYELVSRKQKEHYKVSVIIPVYNVEAYLADTLASLEKQSLDEVEVILVDDGSTDGSPSIILSFLERLEDFVYVKQDHKGPGQARNVGMELARGDYISFVDSDDLLPEDALETMYAAAVKEQAEVIIGVSLCFNSSRSWYIASHKENGVYQEGEKSLIENPEILYSLGPCNKLYRKDLIQDVRFPTGIKVTEDHPFVIEAYLRAKKIYTVDQIIYQYRRRDNKGERSLSQKVQVQSLKVLRDIMNSLKASDSLWDRYLSDPSIKEGTKAFYYNRIIKADIWPVVRQSILSKDGRIQHQVFVTLNDWFRGFSPELFNRLTALHKILTYEVMIRFAMLQSEGRNAYLEMLLTAMTLMGQESIDALKLASYEKEVKAVMAAYRKQSVRPLDFYVFRHRVRKVLNRLKNGAVRRILYPSFKLLPVQKKVIFASIKPTSFRDSFEPIDRVLRERRPHFKIIGYFQPSQTLMQKIKYYYDLATAKYIVLDDYYRPFYPLSFRKGTEVIQIWHAAGAFKKFGFSAIGAADSNTEEFEKRAHGFYTKAVVTGDEVVEKFADAFRMPEANIYPIGLPRTDLFFDEAKLSDLKESYLRKYPILRNKRVITYAPTFRGRPKERTSFTLRLDLEAMARELSEDHVLVLKLHPSVVKKDIVPEQLKSFVLNLSDEEMNHVLAITDLLISDYSSLVFEFALLRRPMLFFAYDLEQYLKERGFYYDYEDFVPGPICMTTEALIEEIQANAFDLGKIDQFKKRFFNHLDGRSSERFVETFIQDR